MLILPEECVEMCWEKSSDLRKPSLDFRKGTRLSIETWRQPPRSVVYTTSMNFKTIRNVLHRVFGSKLDNTTFRRSWNTVVPHKKNTLWVFGFITLVECAKWLLTNGRIRLEDTKNRPKSTVPKVKSCRFELNDSFSLHWTIFQHHVQILHHMFYDQLFYCHSHIWFGYIPVQVAVDSEES